MRWMDTSRDGVPIVWNHLMIPRFKMIARNDDERSSRNSKVNPSLNSLANIDGYSETIKRSSMKLQSLPDGWNVTRLWYCGTFTFLTSGGRKKEPNEN